jgi:hypothetical protein
MKSRLASLGLCFLLAAGIETNAQTGWNWPEDKATAEEKVALYTDNFKTGNYRRAADHLTYLIKNAPNLNKSIYINGVKIYDGLAAEETDPAKKKQYQDSVLLLYDMRIKNFGEEGAVINRKAYDAYRYHKDDQSRYEELYNLFSNAVELNGNNIMDINLLPYMDITRKYKLSGGKVSDDKVLEIYEEIMNILQFKKTKEPNDRLNVIEESVNELLVATITVDCDFVANTLGPKLAAQPDDLKLAKNILRLAFAGKCLDRDISLQAAKVVQKHEPEYGLAKLIGQYCAAREDFDCAISYYEESIELTDDNTKKADSYYSLAVLHSSMGKKVSARDHARKAISFDPTKKEAYTLIGNLYFNSFNDCKRGENPVHDRAVYIAAYEMYSRAGDQDAMRRAREQFPSMEEIFTYNMQVGEAFRVGCWINEDVSIQKR